MRHILAIALTLAALICPTSKAATAEPTVFGLALGAALDLPECASESAGGHRFYVPANDAVCFEHDDADDWSKPVVSERISIHFPADQTPRLSSLQTVSCVVIDGNLQGISFSTRGISDQDFIQASLRKKYGQPSRVAQIKKQNLMGASFSSVVAVWKFSNLTVTFHGTTDSFDDGLVVIDTPSGAEFRAAQTKSSRADARPL